MRPILVWLSAATYAALEAAACQQALAPDLLAADMIVAHVHPGTHPTAVPKAIADAAARRDMEAFLAPLTLAATLKRRIVGFTHADGLTVARLQGALEANDMHDRFVQTIFFFGAKRFRVLHTAWLAAQQYAAGEK